MNRLKYYGRGAALLGIILGNFFLTLFTLTLYYPWARTKLLRYHWSHTEFYGDRFSYTGTGRELYLGYIKTVGIIILFSVLIYFCTVKQIYPVVLILYLCLLMLIPYAAHELLCYKTSRTTWRGIRGGYRGNMKEFVKFFVKGALLTIVTFGLYGFVFYNQVRKYITGHVRLGSLSFHYRGNDRDFFILNLKGIFFSAITFGIYSFWYIKSVYNFWFSHTSLELDGEEYALLPSFTAGKMFKFLALNALILVFTLGFGFPWVIVRAINFSFSNVSVHEAFSPDAIQQTEREYTKALGEDLPRILRLAK